MIKVTIVYDSSIKKCEAACGLDWSSAETFTILKRRVAEKFGATAKLELIDVAGNNPRNNKFKERIKKESLSLPVLLINNALRISGEFDARQLLDAIEVEGELKWKTPMTS
jgi:disulfide oxidoreductase YuzD